MWHPFTQMQISDAPIAIKSASGVRLVAEDGKEYIDAISSWWTNVHGHAHPYIADAISKQAHTLEHVIFAGFTHEPAVRLAERILSYLPDSQEKVFFSDNGSTAIEVAIKMSFQYWFNRNQKKTKIIAFEEAYHGDTFGAMSVGDRDIFVDPFSPFLFDVEFAVSPAKDANKCIEQVRKMVQNNDVAAIIFEPLVQGSGGMLMYEPKVLDEIIDICRKHEVLVIADEVMTGFYRTGKMFASDYLEHKPDIFCLSKGLTGGVMALSLTTCTQAIYDEFLSDNFSKKTFFHGHSFTGNPMACAAANASLDLFEKEETIENILRIVEQHAEFAKKLLDKKEFKNIRQMGTIIAFDIESHEDTNYHNSVRDGLYNYFLSKGVLLRPLGNTIYVLPPYCISNIELQEVYETILEMPL